jgi:hypothetical protein
MTKQSPPETPSDAASLPFQDHLKQALQALRGALTELFARVGAEPSRPPEVAQRLGISRTLAWRACKIIQARDVTSCVQYVPRRAGMRTLLRALERRGAGAEALKRGVDAFEGFEEMVSAHGGDRATIELLSETLGSGRPRADLLESNRKLAFQGCSTTLGIQAGLQLSTYIVSPGKDDPERVDLVRVSGLVDFRRLRPDARWQLFRLRRWSDGKHATNTQGEIPLDPASPAGLPILREFCSDELPTLERIEGSAGASSFELPEGPVGISNSLDCLHGVRIPGLGPVRRSETEQHCDLSISAVTPVERLQLDVLIHRDLPWSTAPRARLASLLGVETYDEYPLGRTPIHFAEGVHELGMGFDTVDSPHYPRYRELLAFAGESAGLDLQEFRGHRISMSHPPVPGCLVMRFDLG